MQRIVGFLLSCVFVLGLTNVSPASAFGGVAKVKITHSHAGGDHHHHHDGTGGSSEVPDSSPTGVPHTHEIFLTGGAFYFSAHSIPVIGFELQPDIFPEPNIVSPPRDPNLDSIFRPPIFIS